MDLSKEVIFSIRDKLPERFIQYFTGQAYLNMLNRIYIYLNNLDRIRVSKAIFKVK